MTAQPADNTLDFVDPALLTVMPAPLQASIDRHRAHLAQLVTALRAAGVAETQVEASVNTLMATYRAELMLALKSWMKAGHDGH
jgi:hypothetical protein